MAEQNRTPEQEARDNIDAMLAQAGWTVQSRKKIDFSASSGIAVREYQTDIGPADYVLFAGRKPVGVVEAKPEAWGHRITMVEEQSAGYATARLKWMDNAAPLLFVYESTGALTRFTDTRDPKPRSREVFSFHRPETMREWNNQAASLRARLQAFPDLGPTGLRTCQTSTIEALESSFRDDRPLALIQMATGSGKTYAAITSIYRLLKHAGAKRILFLVDTRNLGEQAEQEFMAYVPGDDNRKFTELYNVQRLKSSFVTGDSQVCISTIQRMYSLLKDEELTEDAEEINPAELVQPRQSMPIVYSGRIPPEFFDFIIIDECHRSIYNLWRQVLEYFDAYLIGLTATPDNRTYGFFRKNVVSEYVHEQTVADGVNVSTGINESRQFIGICAEYRSEEKILFPDKFIQTRLLSKCVSSGFIEKAAHSDIPRRFIESRIRTTAGQHGTSGTDIKALQIPLCQLAEQREINQLLESKLSVIEECDQAIEVGIKNMESLRQSILRRVFSGQLVPQNPIDDPAYKLLERIKVEKAVTVQNNNTSKKRGRARAIA